MKKMRLLNWQPLSHGGKTHMNTYKVMRDKHQQEVNAFPIQFAFNDEQFKAGMRKLGLNPEDTDQVYGCGGTGGFYRRSDAPRFYEMLERHERERQKAIDADSTGGGYIFDMFYYELANHEYGYTWDLTDTLRALGLSREDIEKSTPLKNGLKRAIAKFKE